MALARRWTSISLVLGTVHAQQCCDQVHARSACARKAYVSTKVADAEACCSLCASDRRCRMWTQNKLTTFCYLATEGDIDQDISTELSTCGMKQQPAFSTRTVQVLSSAALSGSIHLNGTFWLPGATGVAGFTRHPGVLLIAGSGAEDRLETVAVSLPNLAAQPSVKQLACGQSLIATAPLESVAESLAAAGHVV